VAFFVCAVVITAGTGIRLTHADLSLEAKHRLLKRTDIFSLIRENKFTNKIV